MRVELTTCRRTEGLVILSCLCIRTTSQFNTQAILVSFATATYDERIARGAVSMTCVLFLAYYAFTLGTNAGDRSKIGSPAPKSRGLIWDTKDVYGKALSNEVTTPSVVEYALRKIL